MAERARYATGTPNWVDLGAADFDGALRFYRDLFGWEIEVGGEEVMYYSNATLAGARVAGMAPRQSEDQPAVWTTYLASDDVDATAAKIRANGGTVLVEPMQVMEFGRMLIAADPTGAAFGVWQGGSHIGAERVNEPGAVAWHELNTRDGEAADAFYAAVFGITSTPRDNYAIWDVEGSDTSPGICGRLQMDESWPDMIPPHWMVYFGVEDVDKAAAKVTELGGNVNVPPFDIPLGRTAVVSDPWGTHFSILARTP